MRSTVHELGAESEAALAHALESVGMSIVPPDETADLAVDVGQGHVVAVRVKTLSLADPARVRSLLARGRRARKDVIDVLVADTLTAAAKKLLRDEGWGWFDRRGQLFLRAPGLHVEAMVPTSPRRQGRDQDEAVVGKAGVVTALALLLRPDETLRVRATAAEAGMNPSSVSRALGRLRDHLLVEADGRPVVPDLFWALADAWPRAALPLKRRPRPEDFAALDVNPDEPAEPGWALTGTRAALAWGAPVVTAAPSLSELVVPSESVVRRARQRLGDAASLRAAAATIRVAPALTAVRNRQRVRGQRIPVAHPVVVALDLAGDLSRGIEILELWTPPPPFTRVW